MRVKKQIIMMTFLFATSALLFHNCGKFEAQGSASLLSSSCDADMLPVFEDTYYSFFQTNTCKNCHTPTGVSGIPQFAQSNSSAALNVVATKFQLKNLPDKIENKLKMGHQGYTFASVATQLNSYKTQWVDGLKAGTCNGLTTHTTSQTINFFEPHPSDARINIVKSTMTDWQTITWSIPGDFNDVQLSVQVKVSVNPDFNTPENYYVSNLKIKTGRRIHLKKVYVLLNKKTYFVTTYSGLDLIIDPDPEFQNITEGFASGIFLKETTEKYENSDKWSLEIETIEDAT